jgi:hypothetical protein
MGLLMDLLACIKATKEEREFNKQLRKDGLKIAIKQYIEEINKRIPSKEIAIKFVLQELDFAQKEDILPLEFILNSGFHQLEYKDALDRFQENKIELLQIQTILDNFLRRVKNEKEIADISIEIIEQTMQRWEIGKYSRARGKEKEEEVETPIEKSVKKPDIIEYDNNRINEIMEEYSDIIGDIIIGTKNPEEEIRIKAFKEHISKATLEGHNPYALVLNCFYEHPEPSIPISEMDDNALKFLRTILKGFSKQGFSESFLDYMDKYKEEINLLNQQE